MLRNYNSSEIRDTALYPLNTALWFDVKYKEKVVLLRAPAGRDMRMPIPQRAAHKA
jgi:hypothetical protein